MGEGRDVTQILHDAARGDADAAARLLPLVYDELRKLAARRMASESPGHALEATALVHDAYLRLVDVDEPQHWSGRGHFFAAAAEAMRRILVDDARRRKRAKHGGQAGRAVLHESHIAAPAGAGLDDDLLELDAALERLARQDGQAARLVGLRYFAGLTGPQAAELLGVSPRKADSLWAFARAWLRREMAGD